jgi:hypothetical protein
MTFWVAGAVVVAGAAGSYMQAQASKSAASQYANSAQQGINYSQGIYNDIGNMTWPYRGLGIQGNNAIGSMMPGKYQQYDQNGNPMGEPITGSGYLTAQPSMDDLTRLMPNYEFGLKQGMGQFNAGLNAGGGAVSGNAIQGGQQFAQDYAGNQLQNAFNNYQTNRQNVAANAFNVSNIGSQNVATQANAGTNTASNISNMYSSIGNAQAAGTMGQANAYAQGLNSISNYAMLYGMRSGGGGGGTGNSDIRMKENIKSIGWLPNGLPVYSWEYKLEFKDDEYGGHGQFVGVMAQDVEKVIPDAVIIRSDGFKMVDYTKV